MQGWDNTGGCYVANNSCSVHPCYYLDGNQTQNGNPQYYPLYCVNLLPTHSSFTHF